MSVLSISIVTYKTPENFLIKCIHSLNQASTTALQQGLIQKVSLYLVDNSVDAQSFQKCLTIARQYWQCGVLQVIRNDANLGYGNGHNQAIQKIHSDYHVALNPDVDVHTDTLTHALEYMQEHPEVGLLTPFVENENHHFLYLCKRYPNVLVLFLRGFFPHTRRGMLQKKLAYYEMRDRDIHVENRDIMIASGCFMFFRVSVLKKLGGFSPKFFLYFEDFDLTYRLSAMSRIAYVPWVKIVHHGGYAAAKGLKHIYFFCRSSITFFNRFGWSLY